MPVTRIGVQAVTGSPGQPVDIDPARINATITNAGTVAVEYSTGGAWTSIAAGASASVTCDTHDLRLRRAVSGAYPVAVDIDWTAQSEGESASLTEAQAAATRALVSGAGILWANRPSAAANPGMVIRVTDVGVSSNGSLWMSDGTYWRPYGGRVQIVRMFSTVAAPLTTIVGNGTIQQAAMAVPVIPAGMLFPGAQVMTDRRANKVGAVGGVSYFGVGLHPTSNPGGVLHAIGFGSNTGSAANWVGPGFSYGIVTSSTTMQGGSYSGMTSANAGFGEGAIDLTVPQYVVVQTNSSLAAGDSLKILTLNVWIEG